MLPRAGRLGVTESSAHGLAVAVLSGGVSPEHAISLESGAAVVAALESAPEDRRPRQVRSFVLSQDAGPGDLRRVLADVREGSDVAFFAFHGGAGEDGRLQAVAAQLGIAHTGPGHRAAALAMDKQVSRLIAASRGLSISLGASVDALDYARDPHPWLRRLRMLDEGSGLVIKPRHAGSSVALAVLDPDEAAGPALEAGLQACFAIAEEPLVEARQIGVEVTVAVDCRRGGPPEAWTPVEIVPAAGRTFDFEQKYSAGGARETCPPEQLGADQIRSLRFAAERTAAALGVDSGIVRVDFMQSAGDGRPPVLLELNALPGLTDRSLLRLAATERGVSFSDLCLALVADASGR